MFGLMTARHRTETWYRTLIIGCHYKCLSAGFRPCSVCSRLAFALICSGYPVTSVIWVPPASESAPWTEGQHTQQCQAAHSYRCCTTHLKSPVAKKVAPFEKPTLCLLPLDFVHREARFSLVFWWSFLQCSRLF